MAGFELSMHPHRRLNILTGEWLLVSPHRMKRPWQGRIESARHASGVAYDPACYLCPGNLRASGERNPDYQDTFVFLNDFSALMPDVPEGAQAHNGLLVAEAETGTCRVVCFSPRHNLSLAEMDLENILQVVEVWIREYNNLGALPGVNHVQIFENKGELMGCSNPHPHGQIWAQHSIPTEPAKELVRMEEYLRSKRSCLLCDYLELELKEQERLVFRNDHFAAIVPFWAVWPFETIILPLRHQVCASDLTPTEQTAFAEVIKRMTARYDNLFRISFPYSAGLHQAPTDGGDHSAWHFHMHFYPPLLRSASIKKFMVGYEMLASPQRDLTAESGAAQLRQLSDVHYEAG